MDLEGFKPGVRPKGNGSRKRGKTGGEERTSNQAKQTNTRKPKIAFGPTEVATEKPTPLQECIVGFAIKVVNCNNPKQAFDKKLMESLEFIQQYFDKRACFLHHDKEKKLEPIHTKTGGQERVLPYPKQQLVQQCSAGEWKGGQRFRNNGL